MIQPQSRTHTLSHMHTHTTYLTLSHSPKQTHTHTRTACLFTRAAPHPMIWHLSDSDCQQFFLLFFSIRSKLIFFSSFFSFVIFLSAKSFSTQPGHHIKNKFSERRNCGSGESITVGFFPTSPISALISAYMCCASHSHRCHG